LRDKQSTLDDAQVKAFGISYDSADEHKAFRAKYQLTTPLLMDTEKVIGQAYGLSSGAYADRKTFVIDKNGVLKAVIDSIDFSDHGAQILAALNS
jgi:thioredoxin-dependent peroxiredoxin